MSRFRDRSDWLQHKHISTSEWVELMKRNGIGHKTSQALLLFFIATSLYSQQRVKPAFQITTAAGTYLHMTRPADKLTYPWQHEAVYETMVYEGAPGRMRCKYRSRLIVDLVTVQTISCNEAQVYMAPGWDQPHVLQVLKLLLVTKR